MPFCVDEVLIVYNGDSIIMNLHNEVVPSGKRITDQIQSR